MKRVLSLVAIVLISLGLLSGAAFAATNEQQVKLPSDAIHTGLYARAGETVSIEGTVHGDVWVAGSEVDVNGTVEGNVYAAGSHVRIKGRVTGSVHAAGSRVNINGQIGGTVYAAGSDVVIEDGAVIGGAATLAGSNVSVGGSIGQQLYAAGSEVTVAAKVGQSARLAGSQLRLTETALVAGDLRYESDRDVTIANDRAVGGKVTRDQKPERHDNPVAARILGVLLGFAMNLVLAAALLYFGQRFFEAGHAALAAGPAAVFGKGALFLFAVPVAIVFGLLTIIGIPLMVLAVLAYIAVLIVAPLMASYELGLRIARPGPKASFGTVYGALALGLLVVTILTNLPLLGGLASFVLYIIGVGMLVSRGLKRPTGASAAPRRAKPAV